MQRRNVITTPQETLRAVRKAYANVYSVTHDDLTRLLPNNYEKVIKICKVPPIQFEVKQDVIEVEFTAAEGGVEPLIWRSSKQESFIPRKLTLVKVERDIPFRVCVASSGFVFAQFSNECLLNSGAQPALERMTPETVLKKGVIADIPPGKTSQTMRNLIFTMPLGEHSSAYACALRPESLELGTHCFTSPRLEGEWICMSATHMLAIFAVSNWETLKLHFAPLESKQSPDFYILPRQVCEHIKSIIATDLARFTPILPGEQFVFTLQRNPHNDPWTPFKKLCLTFELEYSLLPENLPTNKQPSIPEKQEFIGFCNTTEMKFVSGKLAESILNE